MRDYELVIVLDGKVTSAKKKTFTDKLEKLIKATKGTLGKVKDMGVKELAFKIKKSTTGAYMLFNLELSGEGAKELGNKIRLDDEIIRYLLIAKN